MVDRSAMDVFLAVENKQRNPVPAILAETFLTLDFCHQKQKGKLKCCVHLLYVWIVTHMHAGNHIKNVSDPLRSFRQIPVKERSVQDWKVEFDNIAVQSFKWVCPWYEGARGDIILSCGRFPNIPLMGPRGCISYTPAIVLRQLCWTQKEPRKEQLGGCCFRYSDGDYTAMLAREIKEAWGDIQMAGRTELGKPLVLSTFKYDEWREARRAHLNVPKAVPSMKDDSQSRIQRDEQLEVMKAQMQFLEENKQASDLEIIILQSKCQKMAREIEVLKDECADATETARSKKGKEKVSALYVEKIQRLEEKLQAFTKEKSKLEKEIDKRGQILERIEGEASKRDKSIWSLRMEVKKEKEARKQLEEEFHNEKYVRGKLEQEVERLSSTLARTENDCIRGWTSASQYKNLFEEAAEIGRSWKGKAIDSEKEVEEWKMKYARVTGELSHHVPNLAYRFEKANEQIQKMAPFTLPREVIEFMDSCENIVKGLKRKKTRLLM